jgi:hypothetical protein
MQQMDKQLLFSQSQLENHETSDRVCKRKQHTIDTASATAVSTSGRNEWTSSFCSVRANSRIMRQLSAPRFVSSSRKPAPLKQMPQWLFTTSTAVKLCKTGICNSHTGLKSYCNRSLQQIRSLMSCRYHVSLKLPFTEW